MNNVEANYGASNIYKNINRSRNIILTILSIILIVLFIIDLSIGPSWMPLGEVFDNLFRSADLDTINSAIVWRIRLPMTLTCICVGASLGLAGVQMQTILSNPLASPYTLGISSAASFGASIAILTGFSLFGVHWLGIPISAFIFSLIATFGIYYIGKRRGMNSTTMILSGIVIHFLFQALQSVVQYMAPPEISQQIVFWMFGSLLKASWIGVYFTTAIFFLCITLLLKSVWKITALAAGEERARSLGINTDKLRMGVFFISALLTTGAVSFVGTIGFVGLVAPHFARMAVGEDHRYLSPLSALFGAVLLVGASIFSKLLKPGAMMPIGVVTSLLGVPFLLYIILRRK